jgi:ATP-dependent DNA helicase 2 subunit 1
VKEIKHFEKPGMRLMGFKPKSYLKVHHNIKPSIFAFPDDKRIKGSSQCAEALIKEMVKKEKIAIVRV